MIALSDIVVHDLAQSRHVIQNSVVEDYAALLKDGVKLPPVDVFCEGEDCYLADGFHRYLAHELAGLTEIDATIHDGSLEDAVLFSAGANQTHGIRRTNEDKRRAVGMVLELHPEWSDHNIADHVGVNHETVASVRLELTEPPIENEILPEDVVENSTPDSKKIQLAIPPTEKRFGKDGKYYNIMKNKKLQPKSAKPGKNFLPAEPGVIDQPKTQVLPPEHGVIPPSSNPTPEADKKPHVAPETASAPPVTGTGAVAPNLKKAVMETLDQVRDAMLGPYSSLDQRTVKAFHSTLKEKLAKFL